MSLLVMGLLAHQRKLRKKRARRTREPYRKIQLRPETTMEKLNSGDNNGPANVHFPDGMADGVKQSVHAPQREEELDSEDNSDPDRMADGVQRKLYEVRMKEEWEYYKRLREQTSSEDELLDAISYKDFEYANKLSAVEFLNKALGISYGWQLFRNFESDTNCFVCHLSEAEWELVQGHKDVKQVILRREFEDMDMECSWDSE